MASKKIYIPDTSTGKEEIESLQSFVIVGANGSGKSHLGAWIEKNNQNVLRISAQRALSIPDTINIINEDAAWRTIYYGNPTQTNKDYKWQWGKYTSTLVNDFESVLSSVFSKESNELRTFKDLYDQGNKPDGYITIVEKIKKIWNEVQPQRELIVEKFEAKAKYKEELYKAGYMSDGERVCLYLISQCLITPDNHIIVIDEPEIHLHTSIMKKLWDEIERYCPQKTFVYITHDLNFAASRVTATKIWVKSFDGHDKWDLSVIDKDENIPDELLLEILGARRPVLFVEGDKSSYDIALYKEIFKDYYVVACNNCQKVIELTKAFNNVRVKALHSYEVKGIIDHDLLTEEEIESYNRQNIYPIEVSEVENLFLIEPLIKLAANQIGENPDETFAKVSDSIFDKMTTDQYSIINAICVKEIRHKLNGFSSRGQSEDEIQSDLESLFSNIDVHTIYSQTETRINDIISSKDYKSMIRLYNNKGLCKQVSSMIGFKKSYPLIILDLLKGEKRQAIITALKDYLPQI